MADAFARVLARYNERASNEDELMRTGDPAKAMAVRDSYLLHVGEEVARFLHALIIAHGSKVIVELGTSYGYSTLFLADAARETGGRVFSIELAADKQEYAKAQLEEAGLAGYVEWLQGDAVELLVEIEAPIDLVLLDLWKELYVPCLEKLAPKMQASGIIAADNMLFPEVVRPAAEIYQKAVRALPDFSSTLLRIGQGVELSTYWPSASEEG